MPISIFGFQALWSPVYAILMVLVIALYFLITVKWRNRFEGSEPLAKGEAISFVSGIVLLYGLKGSPVDLMSHILFTYHMVQMAFLLLLVPPLLILGIPNWIWRVIIDKPVINKILSIFTKPILSLIIFAALFSFYHIPMIHDGIKYNIFLHEGYTIILFLSAVFMWIPVVNKIDEKYQLHGLKKIGYIYGNAILITPACALIIFAPTALYETYTNGEAWLRAMALCVPASTLSQLPPISGPEVFSNMTALADQQLGGIVMKILQEIIFAVFLYQIFVQWYRNEKNNADQITQEALLEHQKFAANTHRL